jgi:ABC-type nitrate/sulfonate/bicarbonate transport system permease component
VDLRQAFKVVLIGLALPAALLLLWQVAADRDWVNTLFYPAPSVILERTWDHLFDGKLLDDSRVTLKRLAIGFVLGAVPGVIIGLGAGILPIVRRALYPLATALYVVPRIALLPLVLVAFGIGDPARIFMVAFSVFFIAFFSALSAAQQVSPTDIDTARAFGANRDQIVRSVLLPSSAAAIFSGLRVAMGVALIIIISTEFLVSRSGLGALIWRSYQIFDYPSMYSGIVAVTLLGVALNIALIGSERIFLPWRR